MVDPRNHGGMASGGPQLEGAEGAGRQQRAEAGHLKSRVIKRSLVVGGHKTSVSLEDVFWNELRAIAHARHMHLSELVGRIDSERQHCNLSSAIRLFVFEQCRNRAEGANHQLEPAYNGADTLRRP
jgi:predicted DNA-binding ribbon-helix-helix protein